MKTPTRTDRLMRIRGLNGTQFRILFTILYEMLGSDVCSVSQEALCAAAEIGSETLSRNLDKLVKMGVLEMTRIAPVGSCRTNYEYRLPTICVLEKAPSTPERMAA